MTKLGDSRRIISKREKWERFHADNPEIYGAIQHRAFLMHARGHTKYGMNAIWEWLRWETRLPYWREKNESKRGDYKLDNNYQPLYTRKLIQDWPDMADVFEVREPRKRPVRPAKKSSTSLSYMETEPRNTHVRGPQTDCKHCGEMLPGDAVYWKKYCDRRCHDRYWAEQRERRRTG